MTNFILKLFGLSGRSPTAEKDDFSEFFHDAKSGEKAKVIRQIMREATEEQKAVLERYRAKEAAVVQ
jgi:hypothetical protein